MPEYKNHHYVPQHILNNFKNYENQFFYYNKNKSHKPIEHRNTEKVFCENYLYSYETRDGNKSSEVEFNYFKTLDTNVATIVQSIVECVRLNNYPNLSSEQKNTWNEFFLKQQVRSPERLNSPELQANIDETYKNTKDKIYERLSPSLKTLIDSDEFKTRLQLETKVKSLESNLSSSMDILNERGLYFARITSPNKSFVIGSQPLVRIGNQGSNRLDDPMTELWYPISHDIAVSIGSYKEKEKIFTLTSKESKLIRTINLEITKRSNEIAGKSLALISSLKKNKTSA